MSESMMMVVEKLKNLRESIINKEITDENVIKDKLTKIRLIAEENGVAFIIDDEEYIRYLKKPSIGEESEEEEESSSEEEEYIRYLKNPSIGEESEEEEESSSEEEYYD